MQRIEQLTQDDNGLHAEVNQKGNSRQCQDGRQPRGAYQSFNLLADGNAMLTARIETGVSKEGCQELGHSDGGPYHNDGQPHEPLEQTDLVGPHHVD